MTPVTAFVANTLVGRGSYVCVKADLCTRLCANRAGQVQKRSGVPLALRRKVFKTLIRLCSAHKKQLHKQVYTQVNTQDTRTHAH